MEYIIASICIAGVIAGVIWWDYNQVKDTQEFKDIEEEIEREDRLDEFRKKQELIDYMETLWRIALICLILVFAVAVVGVVWLSCYQDKDIVEEIEREDKLNESRNNKDL